MNYIDLFIDIENKQLVSSRTNAVPRAASGLVGFREDQLPLRLTFLRPYAPGGLTTRFEVVDVTPLSVVVGIADPTGQDAGVALALQGTWTKDETEDTVSGILDLNTTEIATRLAVEEEGKFTSQFSVKITENAKTRTVLQLPITIQTNALPQDIQAPSEVPVISDFVQTLETILVNSNTITWSRNGNEMSGDVKIDPAGDLEATADGIRANSTLARLTDLHDPVTLGDASPNILPVFASDTQDGITVSASSESNPAWKAFDGVVDSTGGGWVGVTPTPPEDGCDCPEGTEPNIWLQIQFPAPQVIVKYEFVGPSDPTRAPSRWYFQASSDGANWATLNTEEEQTDWEAHEVREFGAEHGETGFTHYRWVITAANGSASTEIEEIRMENVCDVFIMELQNQVFYLRGLRFAPGRHIKCYFDGIGIDFEPFQFANNEGGVIRSPTPPDVAAHPEYKNWKWVNSTASPYLTFDWDETTEAWEPSDQVLRNGWGVIIRSSSPPPAATVPFYQNCEWLTESNPPVPHRWNKTTKEWVSICGICGSGNYYLGLPNVEFDPPSGTPVPATVTLLVPGITGATIYYTLDGSEPNQGSLVYSEPLELETNTTIKAYAVKAGWNDSDISSAIYGEVVIEAWLLNFNYRLSGVAPVKTGGAATYNNYFADFWNENGRPVGPNPNYPSLKNADGSSSSVVITYPNWVEGHDQNDCWLDEIGKLQTPISCGASFFYVTGTNADPMFKTAIYNRDYSQNQSHREFTIQFTLPAGVYDLYVYGHGPNDADNAEYYAEDDLGARTPEATSTGSDWNNTAWTEGKQYVLFEDLEPAFLTHLGDEYTVYQGTILLVQNWNGGKTYLNGWQLRKKNQLPKVRFTPVSGYGLPTQVQLVCPGYPSAEIRYTTNGDTPTSGSTQYEGPFNLTGPGPKTVKAIALIPGANPNNIADSAVNSATYV